jgi:dTDP-4-dehydrorhamnose reductase
MRTLILGGNGMLGHRLWLACRERHDAYATLRGRLASSPGATLFAPGRIVEGVSAEDFDSVVGALAAVRPEVVVNCVGIVKQRPAAEDPVASLTVNSLFPHRLARACRIGGIRLVHLSTDCVFSGRRGAYTEEDPPDATDLYGRSKLLGEVTGEGCLTLRTSMIGRELSGSQGLLEWFLAQRGQTVRGFRRALFSGLTTPALASRIVDVIEQQPDLSGLWHVASDKISKHDLLCLIRDTMSLDVTIEPDDSVEVDRSLDDRLFRAATGLAAPDWPAMIDGLAHDPVAYDAIRRGPC